MKVSEEVFTKIVIQTKGMKLINPTSTIDILAMVNINAVLEEEGIELDEADKAKILFQVVYEVMGF